MKVTVNNKGGFNVKPEKGVAIYDLGDYISDGKLLITKERISNLSEVIFSGLNTPRADLVESLLNRFKTISGYYAPEQVGTYIEVKNGKIDKKLSYVKIDVGNVTQYVSLEIYEFLVSGDFLLYTEAELQPIYLILEVLNRRKEVEKIIRFGVVMPMQVLKPKI